MAGRRAKTPGLWLTSSACYRVKDRHRGAVIGWVGEGISGGEAGKDVGAVTDTVHLRDAGQADGETGLSWHKDGVHGHLGCG